MTATLYEELLERSHTEDIPYASGYLVCGLMARTKDDAAQLRLWHAIVAHKAAAEAGDFEPEPHDLALWAHVEDM